MKVITEENLTSWRRHLHQNPELSLEEHKTKEFIASVLKEYGIEYQETLETGLVVICKASVETKDTILFRADIDALPITEENDVDFKSNNDGVMHACGHDAHTAMFIGACKVLYNMRNDLKVNVKFFFQEAEERFG